MPKFEVFIPSASADFPNFTFRVEATNWMGALKTGMEKLGEQGTAVQNLLVDVQSDNSVHVTDSQSNRVFRIREMTDREAAAAVEKKPGPASAPTPVRTATQEVTRAVEIMSIKRPAEASPRQKVPPPATSARPTPPGSSAPPRVTTSMDMRATQIVELERPSQPISGQIGRVAAKPKTKSPDDLLSEVFDSVQELHKKGSSDKVFHFLLDLALEKIPAEAGTVFTAHARSGNLTFAAVRGPKAQQLIDAKMVIPAGTGIAGFCALEGVSVALSEVEKDPRYYAAVAQKMGYPTRSMLCSPMMAGGRSFGCMQVINKKEGATFSRAELNLLEYIAHQGALYLQSR
jgi:hypothetical protein